MIDQSLIDHVFDGPTGYPDDLAALDTPDRMCAAFGDTNRDFPDKLWVEPRDLRERCAENDRLGLWAENYWDRFTNQNPTHECTCHALIAVIEACWNRQRHISFGGPIAGQRLELSALSASVWFSCLSVYAEANPRQWGGANCQQVIGIACERGVLPDKIQPREYGFKHTLIGTCGKGGVNQSNGKWVPLSQFPEGWKLTSKHFMPLECVNPKNEQEYDSLLVNSYAIGIGRNGHSVPVGRIVWDGNRKLYRYKDSYDVFRYDSRPYCSGAYSVLTMTQPDSWDRPAG